jgi:hypothetical protein
MAAAAPGVANPGQMRWMGVSVMKRQDRAAVLAGLCVIALLLTGCGGSGEAAPAATTRTASALNRTASALKVAACPLVSAAEAAHAMSSANLVEPSGDDDRDQPYPHICLYSGGDGILTVSVDSAAFDETEVAFDKTSFKADSTTLLDVPDLGDYAYVARSKDRDDPQAAIGSVWIRGLYIHVEVSTGKRDPLAAAADLLKVAASHVPTA